MRSIPASLLIAFLMCGLPSFAAEAPDAEGSVGTSSEAEVKEIMDGKLKLLLDVFSDDAASETVVSEKLNEIVEMRAITRGVLSKHREGMSDTQIQRFQGEFEKSMVALLRSTLKNAANFDMSVERVKLRDERRASVLGRVKGPAGENFELLASVAKRNDAWKVRNLIVDGINLGLTYRNQFAELMLKHENQVDAAIDAWAATLADAPGA